jgi:excisionase family DNA binding protein
MENENRMSAQEAANYLGYHINHVYRLLAQGKLQGKKVLDQVWLIDRGSVERLKAQQTEAGRLPK